MADAASDRLSTAEYLALERASQLRHELIDGQMVAMSGASRRHVIVAGNLFAALHARLREGGWRCVPYGSDMRVRVADSGLYTYPDLSVACGEARFEDDELDTLLDPILLVEILSPSTAAYDRGEKWERYRRLESLQEYLVIDPDRVHVEHWTRRQDGSWLFSESDDLEDALELPSIECRLPLSAIYETLEPRPPTDE